MKISEIPLNTPFLYKQTANGDLLTIFDDNSDTLLLGLAMRAAYQMAVGIEQRHPSDSLDLYAANFRDYADKLCPPELIACNKQQGALR